MNEPRLVNEWRCGSREPENLFVYEEAYPC